MAANMLQAERSHSMHGERSCDCCNHAHCSQPAYAIENDNDSAHAMHHANPYVEEECRKGQKYDEQSIESAFISTTVLDRSSYEGVHQSKVQFRA